MRASDSPFLSMGLSLLPPRWKRPREEPVVRAGEVLARVGNPAWIVFGGLLSAFPYFGLATL